MAKKLIVANWKLNMPPLGEWRHFRGPKGVDVVICPPFPYLKQVLEILKPKTSNLNPRLGAQDVFWEEKGAYTGEVSPVMLKSLGASYVIIGHSERRRWLNETDEMINKKVKAAFAADLRVILCVGEPLAVRRNGLSTAKQFVGNQLRQNLQGIKKILHSKFYILNSRLVVAYEPIWAIGTGRADKPEEAVEMAKFIKKTLYSKFSILNSRILYGGSVTSKNAANFLKHNEIDGALVGGASLDAREFAKIINIGRY
ncbi:MAG: triose-phosphate isomerase [Patescibacteria group bacterium]